jgi:hypothetical protein
MYIKGTCWSNLPSEHHLKEDCPDMTYGIFNGAGKLISPLFITKADAEQALQEYLKSFSGKDLIEQGYTQTFSLDPFAVLQKKF